VRIRTSWSAAFAADPSGIRTFDFSVADPNPDPPDPHVFRPLESGSISQRYGSGSGSFYHHAKIVRKTLMPTIFNSF
jgi:hypothetical protein